MPTIESIWKRDLRGSSATSIDSPSAPGETRTLVPGVPWGDSLPRIGVFALRRYLAPFFAAVLVFSLQAITFADFHPFDGVTYSHVEYMIGNRPVAYDLIDIDLSVPGISFRATESNGPDRDGDVDRETTREFVTRQNAQIGINAAFYLPAGDQYVTGDPATVNGLAASDGVTYNEWSPFWAAVNIGADNAVSFLDSDPGASAYNAIAGNYRLVRDGVAATDLTGGANDIPDARSALAIDARGHLLLLTVDGRNFGHSLGLTITELADLLAGTLGAVQAINLDGGGSTTLVMADQGAPRVVNVPVGRNLTPGTERSVATSLAVFARVRAVPEPGSASLMVIGCAGLGLAAFARVRRSSESREA